MGLFCIGELLQDLATLSAVRVKIMNLMCICYGQLEQCNIYAFGMLALAWSFKGVPFDLGLALR
jgi:hypothetical protein